MKNHLDLVFYLFLRGKESELRGTITNNSATGFVGEKWEPTGAPSKAGRSIRSMAEAEPE
jgi:hypothetical protein